MSNTKTNSNQKDNIYQSNFFLQIKRSNHDTAVSPLNEDQTVDALMICVF